MILNELLSLNYIFDHFLIEYMKNCESLKEFHTSRLINKYFAKAIHPNFMRRGYKFPIIGDLSAAKEVFLKWTTYDVLLQHIETRELYISPICHPYDSDSYKYIAIGNFDISMGKIFIDYKKSYDRIIMIHGCGDMISSRSTQKGTIGRIIDIIDMPWTQINPIQQVVGRAIRTISHQSLRPIMIEDIYRDIRFIKYPRNFARQTINYNKEKRPIIRKHLRY
jgi:hypothetical protein